MIKFEICEMQPCEYSALEDFLYAAIFVPAGIPQPAREIIYQPELQIYIKNFGTGRADFCYVAKVEKNIAGAAWSRIMNDYGHIDNETPSLALAVLKNFRRAGIATALVQILLKKLAAENFQQVSLSVQKENTAAVNLYRKLQFEIFSESESEYILKKILEA